MKDCKVTLEVKKGVVKLLGEKISPEEMSELAGFMQVFVGLEAVKRGMNLDDVKTALLDIHLAAMEILRGQMKKEGT